jgi:hypothetical protein
MLLALSLTFLLQAPVANRPVFLDSSGVIRWAGDSQEVVLYGANYVLTTASDYRAAGYVGADRKRLIEQDMAHFARMGWDGIRLTFWGDWEASDSAGNLIQNDHLDLLDYLIAKARERGIYMLFSPIQTYSSNWPEAMERDSTTPGFGRVFGRGRLGTDPAAIAAQVNYLKQILNHVNPYTRTALKDEPAILFVELVNEPWHHPEDLDGSVSYINALVDAVRSTGCEKLVFYNVSQDFRIGEAIRRSRAQGVSFGWYPTGLNSGYTLQGNYLRTVDGFPDMLRPEIAKLPRIVYEFDTPDLQTGYLYPAMARTFRSVGTQMALMFSYDMVATASRNLGWQTHYLNLVYTPRKAMSSAIAAEAMRRLPRMQAYGQYPGNTRFGDFRVSYEEDLSELVARDAFLYAGSTRSMPPSAALLRRVAGVGSSPIVRYDGSGAYFLDRIRPGLWRLEVYPDVEPVRDPFGPISVERIVTRAVSRAHPMTVTLPDLGPSRRFTVTPGVYQLSRSGMRRLPAGDFYVPPDDTVTVAPEPRPEPSRWLFDPAADVSRLAFTRIGDAGRRGLYRLVTSPVTGRPAFHLEFPAGAGSPTHGDYTASLVVKGRPLRGDTLYVRLRGISAQQTLHLTLMEDDGTSWTAPLTLDTTWVEHALPLGAFTAGRGVLLPQGFPGQWNYWVGPAAGRGGAGDRVRLERVERLQLSLRGAGGVEVEWIRLGR